MTARKSEYEGHTITNLIKNEIPYDKVIFDSDKVKKINDLRKKYNIVCFADDRASTVKDVFEKCKIDNVYLIDHPHNRAENLDEDITRIDSLIEIIRDLPDV